MSDPLRFHNMQEKDKTSAYAAFLGVVVGVLATVLIFSFTGRSRKVDGNYSQWRKLNLILREVQSNYVDTVDVKKITDAAVVAALGALDPHSVYLPPVELEASETELAGNFDGIGIQFNVPNDTAIVLEVIPGGPSEKVGLQPGDRILKVDSCNIAGTKFPQDSMVRRMKGKAGTEVDILVKRGKETIPFNIKRGKIPVHCVDASFMINDTTGYIRLAKFSKTTFAEVSDNAKSLLEDGMTYLILDLRDNTGGYLDQALLLSDMFLEKDDGIMYMQGLHRPRKDYRADGKGLLRDVSLSVLINENSASSSEIFAGAMQDNDRGTIIGRRSFGKGLVQEPIYFTDNSGIRLTVARYYTPSGRCIQKPYSEDYQYDIYKRYADGEMFDRDSMKVDSNEVYHTVGNRPVYGGGGIIPDVFVPVDTTRASSFFVQCNRKATQMRFASAMFDKYGKRLGDIDNYGDLDAFIDGMDIPGQFRKYAASVDGITPAAGEWEKTESYLIPQLRALVGRYSKLGDNAFYRMYLKIDEVVKAAVEYGKPSD